jgi:SAM-dependent methyltransferase
MSARTAAVRPLKPHGKEWYERLATLQDGYFYPWRSRLEPGNGEDAYLELVGRHLSARSDVLDVGCGHGAHALEIAARCRSVLAYDRVAAWIARAEAERRARGAGNVAFLCHDSSPEANGGRARLPGEARSYDLVISRRGPLHWIADAGRVARPGAAIVMLLPGGAGALNAEIAWAKLLPSPFGAPTGPLDPPLSRVRERLVAAGLELDALWTYDAREWFDEPRELYNCLSFGWGTGEAPSWEESRPAFERIFREHAVRGEIWVPHGRTLWRSVVPGLRL